MALPKFLLLPKRSELPKIWGGCSPPPPPPPAPPARTPMHLLTGTGNQGLGAMCISHFKDRLYEVVRDCQHGFIREKSCTSNLLKVLDHMGSLLHVGKTGGHNLYGYPSKVNHGCMLQKLHVLGFGGSLLQWFSSYLMGRYQCVTVLSETSDPLPVSSGVPQGSILGPMLFLIYVTNLPDSVLMSHIAMFADKTKIYKQNKSREDAAYLQADLLAG